MSVREFWIDRLSESELGDSKSYECYTHVASDLPRYKDFFLVREVNPAYDAAVQGLVEALEWYQRTYYDPYAIDPHHSGPNKVFKEALAAWEKVK